MDTARRILLAEDHAILRDGLRAILSREPDLEVVGEAGDGCEAVARAAELRPDLVLLDLSMPHMGGLEALARIKETDPRSRVLVLSAHKEQEYVLAALGAGADGYAIKDQAATELLNACRAVLAGRRYLSVAIAGLAGVAAPTGGEEAREVAGSGSGLDRLSAREREVLTLVAEGRRTREIAACLFISPRTVERHRAVLMKKLRRHTISALTLYAIDHGLLRR